MMEKSAATREAYALIRALRAAKRQIRVLRALGGIPQKDRELILKAARLLENEFGRFKNGEK
jgi:hypothetical protein